MSGSGSAEKIAGSKASSKSTITKRVSNILVGESNKRYHIVAKPFLCNFVLSAIVCFCKFYIEKIFYAVKFSCLQITR